MPPQILALAPWVSGANTADDPISLGLSPQGQQFLAEADNVIFSTSGSRIKRPGQIHNNSSSKLVSGASATDGVFGITYWRNNSNSTKVEELVVATETGELYYSPAFNGSMTLLVASAVSPTFSLGQVTGEVMGEVLYLGYSRSSAPLSYTGGGATFRGASASTSIAWPVGNLLRQHINRMWVAGSGANRDRIYYSASEDARNWGSSSGFIDIYPGDGDPVGITAIFPSVTTRELYVAKRASLYRIDTSSLLPSEWAVIPVSRAIGCVGQNTAQAVDQFDVFFCSDRGVHSLQQVVQTVQIIPGQYLSKDIQPDYDNISAKSSMSALWMPELNSYLLGYKRSTVVLNEGVLGYNVKIGGWYFWSAVPNNFLLKRIMVDASPATKVYACADGTGSGKGFVNELNQERRFDFVNSASGAITMTIKSVILYPGGDFIQEHNFTDLIFLVRSRDDSSFQVTYTIDEAFRNSDTVQQKIIGGNILGSSSYLLGTTFVLGSPSGVKPLFMSAVGVGNGVQIEISHMEVDSEFELFGMALIYEDTAQSQYAYRAFPNATT